MQPFLQALEERVLVCDGAMGTMLYAQGVFINRSFDSLNLTEPDRIRAVHAAYVQSGAEVLETNTFGANRLKLRAFGLTDRLRDINVQGARLARQAAGQAAYVAGAIGPLGLRIEPWGRTGRDEAVEYFREQAAALQEGGVDLFILETFRDLTEIGAATDAVRQVSDLPIVAQMTIEEDGNSLDGTPPEQFAPVLETCGVSVIGLNCSIGPAHMLEALERMAASTKLPLAAQPNAGRPRDVEGRTIYLTSPEYMASYARRFADRRVRLVGGCCGTTPEHIALIRLALARASARAASTPAGRARVEPPPAAVPDTTASLPKAEPGALRRAFAAQRTVTTAEVVPPRGHDARPAIEQARQLRTRGVEAVMVSEGPSGARLNALSLAVLVQQQAGIDAVLQYGSREKALLGMQSELLGAYAMGIGHLVAVTGDVRPAADYSDAAAVVDVDSIGLVNAVSRLNRGLDVGGQPIGSPTRFHLGVTVNPGAEDLDAEVRRFQHKVEAGAEFVITRPVFDVRAFEALHRRIEDARLPIVVGLRPFLNLLDAEYLANEVPGVIVPAGLLERLRRVGADAQEREGVTIAAEIGRTLLGGVQGVNVVMPPDRFDLVLSLLDALA